MSEEKHHASCGPNDRGLVYHCDQCGLNEPFDENIIDSLRRDLAQAREKIKDLEQCGSSNCPNHPRNKDPWVRESSLAAEQEKNRALMGQIKIAEDDLKYIAEQCEKTGRVEGISFAESRTWKIVGRLAREAAAKIGRPE